MSLQTDTEYYYWPKGEKFQLGQHFSTLEFQCHCAHTSCTRQRASIELIKKLDRVRETLGAPVKINSGYRCAAKQADLKAQGYETAKGISQHELGNAADVAADSMHELLSLCNGEFKAVGAARSFVHVDTRADKVRHWSYVKM
jgi:uncharacterized protein YcbK (DUF882 family)